MADGADEAWRVPTKPRPSPLWWVLGVAGAGGLLIVVAIVALALRTEEIAGGIGRYRDPRWHHEQDSDTLVVIQQADELVA